MFNAKIAFDQPWWLLLLVLVPVLWIFSFRSLSGLGPYRRVFALLFRNSPRNHPLTNAAEAALIEGPVSASSLRAQPGPRMGVRMLLRSVERCALVNLVLCGDSATNLSATATAHSAVPKTVSPPWEGLVRVPSQRTPLIRALVRV